MAPPAGIIVTGKSSRGDGQGAMTGFTLDRTAKKLISLDESNILADRIPAIIRLKKDLEEMNPLPSNIQVSYPAVDDDPFIVDLHIIPDEGPYSGGLFIFRVRFKPLYPIEPPKVRCMQRAFHPNIEPDGPVCMNILGLEWSPVLSLSSVMFGLLHLLYEPHHGDPLNKEAAALLRDNPKHFHSIVWHTMAGGSYAGVSYDHIRR